MRTSSKFGFERRPFALSPDPTFLYRSASHDVATEQLKQALQRREGFLVLTGDIGTGKTTLCRVLLGQMGPASFTSLILNPFLSVDELLREVLLDFGVVSREAAHNGRFDAATTHDMMSTLHEFLQSIATIGGTAILIIDEAQHLTKPVLEQIRVLSNLEASDTNLLQIVLVGQLNLLETLSHADMRQFAQRISLRAKLSPLTLEETEAYIRHRIAVTAPKRQVGVLPGRPGVRLYDGRGDPARHQPAVRSGARLCRPGWGDNGHRPARAAGRRGARTETSAVHVDVLRLLRHRSQPEGRADRRCRRGPGRRRRRPHALAPPATGLGGRTGPAGTTGPSARSRPARHYAIGHAAHRPGDAQTDSIVREAE